MGQWTQLVHHDLLKHAFWAFRDGAPVARLFHGVTDDEGTVVGALARWRQLRAKAPASVQPWLDGFESALQAALASEQAMPELERAFLELQSHDP